VTKTLAALLALAFAGAAHAQISGVVVGVPDGDTLSVRIDRQVLNLDLRSIDAPEIGQPYGAEARDSLAALCADRTVKLDELGIDTGRRIIGEAECDGVDASEEQVKRGFAWTAKRKRRDVELETLQAQAQSDRRGLWQEATPVPPWEWSAKLTQ
jgi:endonuclease YncB( thermonuclease family)